MKRLLGVVLVLFMACFPMNIHAEEVDLSFEYTGQKIEVENAAKYYTIAGVLLDKVPTDCGTYIAWTSDEETILFEIKPKKVPVKVTYNKDWRENDPDEEKYLCNCVGDFEFKLRIDTGGDFFSLNDYDGNYDFQFEPKNVKDVEIAKTRITHPDVEYVYSEDGIQIYSDIDQVEPILLKDVGEYTVAFDLDERYYESVPFKVTILPKTVQLKLDILYKYFGQEDPSFEYDNYILSREPGEDIGGYKLTVQSKSKNYKYDIIENDVFSILEKKEAHREQIKHAGAAEEIDKKEETPIKTDEVQTATVTNRFTNSMLFMLSLFAIFILIFKGI